MEVPLDSPKPEWHSDEEGHQPLPSPRGRLPVGRHTCRALLLGLVLLAMVGAKKFVSLRREQRAQQLQSLRTRNRMDGHVAREEERHVFGRGPRAKGQVEPGRAAVGTWGGLGRVSRGGAVAASGFTKSRRRSPRSNPMSLAQFQGLLDKSPGADNFKLNLNNINLNADESWPKFENLGNSDDGESREIDGGHLPRNFGVSTTANTGPGGQASKQRIWDQQQMDSQQASPFLVRRTQTVYLLLGVAVGAVAVWCALFTVLRSDNTWPNSRRLEYFGVPSSPKSCCGLEEVAPTRSRPAVKQEGDCRTSANSFGLGHPRGSSTTASCGDSEQSEDHRGLSPWQCHRNGNNLRGKEVLSLDIDLSQS